MLMAQLAADSRIASPAWLAWLWLVPVVASALMLSLWLRRRAVRRLVGAAHLRELATPAGWVRGSIKVVLTVAGLGLIIVALARPQWDARTRTIERTGRDVVFVLDVSRSMLAEDLRPNRIERAKVWIRDAVSAADGDRVGLVAFAGGSVIKSPLTLDYGFFGLALDRLDTHAVARGGTLIGDAIRTALNEVFDRTEGRHRDIVLITDGEDQGSYPVEAARQAKELGVRIIALGIGSEHRGTRIPITDDSGERRFLEYRGEPVRSRLDREGLRRIALASDRGVYLHVGTGNIELDQIYEGLIARAAGSAVEDEQVVEYDEKYQVPLGLGLGLLLLEAFIGATRRMA